ncbi:MAG: DUF72 domain-containing protein [Bacillota bacterium]
MILIGTAGFSYADWKGEFYPADVKDRDMLQYYAERFPAVEIDFTYYRLPTSRGMAGMVGKTPAGFEFCVKAYKGMTHKAGETEERRQTFQAFREALAPVADGGRLGCVLAQFPWSFRPSPESLAYLEEFRDRLDGLPTVVEFRNSEWVGEETFGFLRRAGLGFCCVDEPALRGLMPRVARATSDLAYVRFHGRNAAKWWRHDEAWERYNYLYTEEQLGEWVPKLRALEAESKKTYVLYNNCHAGHAARNAKMMQTLLDLDGPGSD